MIFKVQLVAIISLLLYYFHPVRCQSPTYIERQLLCALDRAPCDEMGNQIKAILPEIIGGRCKNCSPAQITYANNISKYIQERYPQAWGALLEKYS